MHTNHSRYTSAEVANIVSKLTSWDAPFTAPEIDAVVLVSAVPHAVAVSEFCAVVMAHAPVIDDDVQRFLVTRAAMAVRNAIDEGHAPKTYEALSFALSTVLEPGEHVHAAASFLVSGLNGLGESLPADSVADVVIGVMREMCDTEEQAAAMVDELRARLTARGAL